MRSQHHNRIPDVPITHDNSNVVTDFRFVLYNIQPSDELHEISPKWLTRRIYKRGGLPEPTSGVNCERKQGWNV